ncbi:MAG TPA: hypothetical protein VIL94_02435 [Acidothermaceae bacterium]
MKKLIMSAGMTIVLAGAVAGCAHSSTVSPVSAQSALASGVSGPASAAATGSSSSTSMPADSMPAQPTPADTSPAAPTPPVASPTHAVVTPTATPAIGAHAVATIGTAVVACPDPEIAGGGDPAAAHLLAAGVVIDAVVKCETVTRTYPGAGTFTVQLAEVADTGLADFLTELRRPSDPRGPNVVCPLFRIATPWFALIEDHGAVLRVALPTTQCGQSRAAVIAALNALPFHEVAAVRIARVTTAG